MKTIITLLLLSTALPIYEADFVTHAVVPVKEITVAAAPKPADPALCLAKNIYFEAGGESYGGKLGVGQVTINRSKSGQFPRSICGVVYQSVHKFNKKICQFSWACEHHSNIVFNSKAWRDSLAVSRKMLAGKLAEEQLKTGKALYFHNGTILPQWAASKTLIASIDNHTFYSN